VSCWIWPRTSKSYENFYHNQKHSWEALQAAVAELAQNRLQLETHETAGPALARMEEILKMKQPYGQLHEVADLVRTARGVNDQIVTEARSPAVKEIQGLLSSTVQELESVSADATLRSRATAGLSKLLEEAEQATSIAHIAQARQAAEEARDQVLNVIEEALGHATDVHTPGTAPRLKKHRVVEAKALWTGDFIESAEEMEAFLSKLRAALQAALDNDERVQLK